MNQAIVACAIIYRKVDNQIQILLTQRSQNSSFLPGSYEIPGGHIELNESLNQGLIREIQEELSISIEVESLFDAFTYTQNGLHTVELVYFAKIISNQNEIKIQESEIAAYRWIKEAEIDSIIEKNKKSSDPEILILRKAFIKLAKVTI